MATYEYNGINQSPTIVVKAGADLTEVKALALALGEDGAALPAAGDAPVGIALVSEDGARKKGEDITVQIKDIGFWSASGEIAAGDLLTPNAKGQCQKVAAGNWIYARALTAATAEGDLVKVQIMNAGKEAAAAAGSEG